jgi:DNA-binding NtrC family response regulator
VPVSAALLADPAFARLLRGRTLLVLARDNIEQGWGAAIHASLLTPNPHMVLFSGDVVVPGVHTVALSRHDPDHLMSSVCPPASARRHLRVIGSAARRSHGVLGRFERLLFARTLGIGPEQGRASARCGRTKDGRRQPEHRAHIDRVAEDTAAYAVASAVSSAGAQPERARGWPAPGEVVRLRKQMESARALLAAGRYQPGERLARQTMQACARRGEWGLASASALMLARSLVHRGRLPAADPLLDEARRWAAQTQDLQATRSVALLRAAVRTESGRLAEAERILEPVLASASSAAPSEAVEATVALVRCLIWQGRYADAAQRLALLGADTEVGPRDAVLIWLARSRVALGRQRAADAVAEAARARDAAVALEDHALSARAFYACALAQLSAGDAAQADAAAKLALTAARVARDPMLAICVRTLRAEIARRHGHRGPANVLVKRMLRVPSTTMPVVVRSRIELLRDLLAAEDPGHAADRRAEASGLPALRLFAPRAASGSSVGAGPATEAIIELLHCCQSAEEDRAVLATLCGQVRARLSAVSVAFFIVQGEDVVVASADGNRVDPSVARRVLAANQLVMPHAGGDRIEAGVPVRYAGEVIGALVAVWTPGATWHAETVSVLLSTGAAAAGPALGGYAARRAPDRSPPMPELIGVSTAIADVRAAIERAAGAPFPVLVEGESGSGKELVARLLHKRSPRRDRPFCSLNCAALPDDLVESELFGHARGAFTGAVAERRGVFEDAHTGTLFLDEIGELSARAQAKLLRAIQEGEIRRVGESVCRRVDVRLITATNRDLREEARTGRFRLDLLYRLDVIRIALPPLRVRQEDVPVLAEQFWRDASSRIGSRATLSAATLAALTQYDWPGNVRELQNVLASLAVRSPKRGVVQPSALPPQFAAHEPPRSLRLDDARRQFEQSFIRAALVRAGGRRTRAAEELGVSRQGLAKLMARLEISEAPTAGRH